MSDPTPAVATNGVSPVPADTPDLQATLDKALDKTPEKPAEVAPERAPERTPEPEGPFSWLQPHVNFVIVLVGPEEIPFGVHKDFLCARSSFYREYFKSNAFADNIEHVVKLPNTSAEVFGRTQHFLFTGQVADGDEHLPDYETMIGVWKMGFELGIEGLCERSLDAMNECRRVTQSIPATPLLVQVWKDTPVGSAIRNLLLSWASEYMRSSDDKEAFAKSLPKEVLMELVIAMSTEKAPSPAELPQSAEPAPKRNVHYLDDESDEEETSQAKKTRRVSAPLPTTQSSKSINRAAAPLVRKAAAVAAAAAATAPKQKPVVQKRRSIAAVPSGEISTQKKVELCADLLERMLSGPGFWTRLVGPFKEPVDPAEDGVPDYFDKIKKPMDLNTIKAKMGKGEYKTEDEFAADVRQIFENCYTYWGKDSNMWTACEKFQKTFEEKYAQMTKNITKMMREPVE
ncbi:Bromodomain testis-specific protein [Colletotrichum trifolii]|uniref:Bromodomain testis-specific protein n=1 Tax=Colletotrichum trifolii TaxID=5466 RepID=A0A4R8QX17_COLTR|nr:Bromodomain testis-specific protein [Colletotrichum trifolii]